MQHDLYAMQRLLTETEKLAATHGRPMDLFHLMDGRIYVAMLRRDAQAMQIAGQLLQLRASRRCAIPRYGTDAPSSRVGRARYARGAR